MKSDEMKMLCNLSKMCQIATDHDEILYNICIVEQLRFQNLKICNHAFMTFCKRIEYFP